MIPNERLRDVCLASGLLGLAFALRLYGISWGLPEGYEEATPLRKAWEMWGWGLSRGVDPNPHFFKYPSLTVYLHGAVNGLHYLISKLSGRVESALDFQVGYVLDKTPVFVLGRLLNVVFGVTSVLLVYVLGRRTGGYAAAVPAALWLALSTAHVSRSQMIEVDVPLTLFSLLTLWLLVRAMERPSTGSFALVGLAMGLAMSTKYTGALLGLPVLAGLLLSRDRDPAKAADAAEDSGRVKRAKKRKGGRGKASAGKGEGRRRGRMEEDRGQWARPAFFLLLTLVVALAVFVATSPYVLLDFDTFWSHFSAEREHMRLGHFGEHETPTWLHYLRLMGSSQPGWPIGVFALAGMVYFVGFLRRRWALVLCLFLVPYALGISTWEMRADRYLLPLLPIFCLFAGAAVSAALKINVISGWPVRAKTALVAGLTIALAVPFFLSYPEHLRRARPDTRTVVADWIRENVPAGSFLVTEQYGPQLLGPVEYMKLDPTIRREVSKRADVGSYAFQSIPMFQVKPERAGVYYQLSMYGDADYIITTSSVRSRYLREPSRFARQIAFYNSLRARYEKVFEADPSDRTGPTIEVYKNTRQAVPFARRGSVSGVPRVTPDADSRAFEADFYSRLGFNYEFHAHFAGALGCYRAGLTYQMTSVGLMKSLVLGAVRCLTQLGRQDEIPGFLDMAIAAAPTAAAREEFRRIKRSTVAGMK